MTDVRINQPNDHTVMIEMGFIEAIGLYKMAMAKVDPDDIFFGDEDLESVSAALQVQLAGIVGP